MATRSSCALCRRWRHSLANMAGRIRCCSTFMTSRTSISKMRRRSWPASGNITSPPASCANTCQECVSSRPSLRQNFAAEWTSGCRAPRAMRQTNPPSTGSLAWASRSGLMSAAGRRAVGSIVFSTSPPSKAVFYFGAGRISSLGLQSVPRGNGSVQGHQLP